VAGGGCRISFIIDEQSRVLVQGITGHGAHRSIPLIRDYGTSVVGGVNAGSVGGAVCRVRVFDTVVGVSAEFTKALTTLISVSAPYVLDACREALAAGCRLLVIRAERIPHHIMLEVISIARELNARVIGGNSLGILVPGKARVGNLGGEVAFAR